MELSEEDRNKVEKALKDPVFIYFSDDLLKIRRNLIILASITLAYKLSGAEIKSFNPGGITFTELAPGLLTRHYFSSSSTALFISFGKVLMLFGNGGLE